MSLHALLYKNRLTICVYAQNYLRECNANCHYITINFLIIKLHFPAKIKLTTKKIEKIKIFFDKNKILQLFVQLMVSPGDLLIKADLHAHLHCNLAKSSSLKSLQIKTIL